MFTFFSRPIAALLEYAQHIHRRREQIRAQRVLNSLPEYLRKDIGWPDREFERETRIPALKPRATVWDTEAMLARTQCPPVFGMNGDMQARKSA